MVRPNLRVTVRLFLLIISAGALSVGGVSEFIMFTVSLLSILLMVVDGWWLNLLPKAAVKILVALLAYSFVGGVPGLHVCCAAMSAESSVPPTLGGSALRSSSPAAAVTGLPNSPDGGPVP